MKAWGELAEALPAGLCAEGGQLGSQDDRGPPGSQCAF